MNREEELEIKIYSINLDKMNLEFMSRNFTYIYNTYLFELEKKGLLKKTSENNKFQLNMKYDTSSKGLFQVLSIPIIKKLDVRLFKNNNFNFDGFKKALTNIKELYSLKLQFEITKYINLALIIPDSLNYLEELEIMSFTITDFQS